MTTEVRPNDLGGWSAICEVHGLLATGPDKPLAEAVAEDHGHCGNGGSNG